MKNRWVYPLFNSLLVLALPFIGLGVLVRWRRRIFSKNGAGWRERWGHLPPAALGQFAGQQKWWWVHAVSMGEVKAIEAFLKRVPAAAGVKVLLTAVTPEALAWAQEKRLAHWIMPAPFDLPWVVRRVMRTVRPKMFISVESEFWPNVLREAKRAGAQVALINGRISEHSFKSYSRIAAILPVLWENIDFFCVRQPEDAQRFSALGVPDAKLHVTGNLKYDLYLERRAHKRHIEDAPIVVMGSTREGEESELLPALERVRAEIPALHVIWAPRHIERIKELEVLLKTNGLAFKRISEMRKLSESFSQGTPYVLWDSMGDLLDAYRQADVAVVGGSFVPKGGQNPIEPAALKLPILFGPSMDNFQSVAETLLRSGGAQSVAANELDTPLSALLKDPQACEDMGERAHQAVLDQQGATERTLTLLLEATPS